MFNYTDWPENSFIYNHLKRVDDTSPPRAMHLWAAITGICALVNGGVEVKYARGLPCNLYVLFVAEQGIGKSTAAEFMMDDIVRQVLSPKYIPSSTTSCAAFTYNLQKRIFVEPYTRLTCTPMSMFATEFHSLLAMEKGLFIELMTEMWHKAEMTRTVMKGGDGKKETLNVVFPKPRMTFLGCTTPDKFAIYMNQFLASGPARRFIFVSATKNHKNVPWLPFNDQPKSRDFLEYCVAQARQLAKFVGYMDFTKGFREIYDREYHERLAKADDGSMANRNLAGYYRTSSELLIKLAVAVALSNAVAKIDNDDTSSVHTPPPLTEYDISRAVQLLTDTEVHLHNIYEITGVNKTAAIEYEMLNWIRANSTSINTAAHMSTISVWKAFKNRFPDHRAFTSAISSMEQSGQLKNITIGGTTHLLLTN